MADRDHERHEQQPSVEVGHEPYDRAVWSFVYVGGVAVIFVVFGLAFAAAVIWQSAGERLAREPAVSPLAAQRPEPPGPRLQVSPRLDMQQFRAREDATLSTYGWIDRDAGVVRVPIERAMELLVEESR